MFNRLLVGFDGTETARRALARAASLAKSLEAELIAVFASGHGGGAAGNAILQEAGTRYREISFVPVVREGDPTDVILDVGDEHQVDAIVVGNKGMTGTKRSLLGSVPNNVSHHASCHVLIVNTTQPGPELTPVDSFETPYGKVLCGVDGSDRAIRALELAISLAECVGSRLLILSAFKPPDQASVDAWNKVANPEFVWQLTPASTAEAAVERAARTAAERGMATETAVEKGDPSEVILRVADERVADLIVVGNKGMAGVQRFVLGSVPNKISHHTRCDLLIVNTN